MSLTTSKEAEGVSIEMLRSLITSIIKGSVIV